MPVNAHSFPSDTVSSVAPGIAALLVTRDGAPPVRWDRAAPPGSGVTLTYSFLDTLPADYTSRAAEYAGFMPFSEDMRAVARTSLAQWAALANIRFAETAGDSGQIRFGVAALVNESAHAYYPADTPQAGDVWLNRDWPTNLQPAGGYGEHVLIHEIGHALGLKHSFDGAPTLAADQDNFLFTAMSATSFDMLVPRPGNKAAGQGSVAVTNLAHAHPGLYDAAAIQTLYGPNTATGSGNDSYRLAADAPFQRIIWDAAGHDGVDASAFRQPSRIDLRPGSFSSIGQQNLEEARQSALDRMGLEGADRAAAEFDLARLGPGLYQGRDNLTITFGTVIEDAQGGSGNDVLTGNSAGNHLVGNAGDDQLFGSGGDDQLAGGTGDDHLDGGNGFDRALFDGAGGVVVDLSAGVASSASRGRDALVSIEGAAGSEGNDVFSGTAGDNIFHGYGGDDTVVYSGSTDYVDGGSGHDTLTGLGLRREYGTVTLSAGGTVIGGTTTSAVETIQFADGRFVTDVMGIEAQVFRLYGATLGRVPDRTGLQTWVDAIRQNALTLSGAAEGFTGSAEFQERYGNPDPVALVNLLYGNVLQRAGEPSGVAGWVEAVSRGLPTSQVVLGFSESAENILRTTPAIQQGIWMVDDQAAIVARLYDTVLDRQPDGPGIRGWIGALKGGLPLRAVADGFTGSAEFQMRYGVLDDVGFVRQLYRNVLDRDGEQSGVDAWVGGITGGMSRADVVIGFSESQEHRNRMAPAIDDGIWYV